MEQGRLEEAMKVLIPAVDTLIDNHPLLSLELQDALALVLRQCKGSEWQDEAEMFRKLMQKKEQLLGPDYASVVSTVCELGVILMEQGQLGEA
jgi:hypothetical protein